MVNDEDVVEAERLSKFMKLRQVMDVVEIRNEVDKYLLEPLENLRNPNFDLLSWWRENSPRFPILSQFVKDVFSIPISTVALESAFNLGGRIKDPTKEELEFYDALEKIETVRRPSELRSRGHFTRAWRKGRWLVFVVFTWMFVFSAGRELKIKHKDHGPVYNHTLATILVRYASTVYLSDLTELFTWTCSRCDGLIKDFEMIELVVDIQHCLQAFVGVAQDPNAIIIAFRGTQEHSIQNWVEDLFWKQLDLDYPGMPDAMVHHGFFNAYHNTTIRPGILNAIARAKEFYGDIDIIVTGHSMGGAMASFCALDLRVNQKERNVQVMTFGQPRIGNAAFASYFSELVPNTIRVTNEHDMVPHLPPYYTYFPQKTYHHFPREVWLYNVGIESLVYEVEKICDDSGEDPTCSRSVSGNSISDHLVYFGVELMAKTWRRCRIVMGPGVVEYSRTDLGGNFVLSRDLATPVLKLNAMSEAGAKPL
ncbi:hypothetical protein L3X38_002465 [Prunus dulcis]|uniref:Alpha/beta-Hydrolases superfamily protein n=1 Tax=Prunus dulcis TaxID=3755 RepID=A0AAD4WY51_PRUDU|nr:hypothetical protein L3X38_002465 [Prunus dulcis]